jgi:hypothetical protein
MENNFHKMTFQVLTAAGMKMTAFWKTVPRSLIEADRRLSCVLFPPLRRHVTESHHQKVL